MANGCYIGAVNRVGTEAPWNIGRFYGSAYIVNPRGKLIAKASEDKDELLVFPGLGTNICFHRPVENPDPQLVESSEVRVRGHLVSQRISACPIEPRSSAAQFGEDGRLTAWISSQTPHQDKGFLGTTLGLDEERVRVVAPDVGGGFGAKGARVEDVLVAWMARATGRPVRWTETRSESMVALQPGRAMVLEFPQDPTARTLDRQYMFGDDLLVAPVFHDRRAEYYLPDGEWTHLVTGEVRSSRARIL